MPGKRARTGPRLKRPRAGACRGMNNAVLHRGVGALEQVSAVEGIRISKCRKQGNSAVSNDYPAGQGEVPIEIAPRAFHSAQQGRASSPGQQAVTIEQNTFLRNNGGPFPPLLRGSHRRGNSRKRQKGTVIGRKKR